MNRLVIVKVGGSLLDWAPLPDRLAEDLAERRARGDQPALIVGGGRAADLIRDLDGIHRPGDDRAHDLALRAMDLTAYALETLVADLEVVAEPDDFDSTWEGGRTPILITRHFLDDDDRWSTDPLPQTWDVTSDSIAARIAAVLGAAELALLKSAPLPPNTNRDGAARLGLVDPWFPVASRPLQLVTYRHFRDPTAAAIPIA